MEMNDWTGGFCARRALMLALFIGAVCNCFGAKSLGGTSAKVDFNRDIRLILSGHCYACHGPDEGKRKAGLRLDVQEDAFKELKSGNHALVEGSLEKSALIQRITSSDPEEVMPPPKHNKPLKPEQIDLLKRWVQDGA